MWIPILHIYLSAVSQLCFAGYLQEAPILCEVLHHRLQKIFFDVLNLGAWYHLGYRYIQIGANLLLALICDYQT